MTTPGSSENNPGRPEMEDIEFSRILAKGCDDPGKLLLMTAMSGGGPYGSIELLRLFRSIQQDAGDGVHMDRLKPRSYCEVSLHPIDMVEQKAYKWGNRDVYKYNLTDKGESLGIAMAGFLLHFAEKDGLQLNKTFGVSSTAHNSDPQTGNHRRWQILRHLGSLPHDNMSATELAVSMGQPEWKTDISQVLSIMSHPALFAYEPNKEHEKPWQRYAIDLSALAQWPFTENARLQSIAQREVLRTSGDEETRVITTKELYDMIVDDAAKEQGIQVTRDKVVKLLFRWHKNGLLERLNPDGVKQYVRMTDQNHEFLGRLCGTLLLLQNMQSDALRHGRNLAREIVADPSRVTNLL